MSGQRNLDRSNRGARAHPQRTLQL